ncbi:MAG: tetratricopeptide repeat protein [Thermodesulfobacteriota bacterium]|nr:tetratricopeptide repeat protein [Thermodesulfobacteriota bacterium]
MFPLWVKKTSIIALIFLFFPISYNAIGKESIRVVDVKFKMYKGYSRVVFLLDGKTSYKFIPDLERKRIVVNIPDSSLKLNRPLPQLKNKTIHGVLLEKKPNGSVHAEVKLWSSRVEITHFLYHNPPSIVINIREEKQSKAKRPTVKKREMGVEKKYVPTKTKKKTTVKQKRKQVTSSKVSASDTQNLKQRTKKPNTKEGPKRETRVPSTEKGLEKRTKVISHKEPMNIKREQIDIQNKPMSDDTKEAADMFGAASQLYQENRFVEAIEKLESLRKLFPQSQYAQDAAFLIGDCHFYSALKFKSGRYNSAIDAYRTALRRYPDSARGPWAAFQIGESFWMMNILYEAEAGFRIVVDKYPKSKYAPQAQIRIAECMSRNQKHKAAVKEFKKFLTHYHKNDQLQQAEFGIADAYTQLKDFISALEYYQKAVKKWPKYPNTHSETLFNMGYTYFHINEYKKAIDTFLKFLNIFPKDNLRSEVLMYMGDALQKQRETEAALGFYAEALAESSDDEDLWRTRLKMADLGVVKPDLKVPSSIFNYDAFINPLKTYEEISKRFMGAPLGNIGLLKEGLFHLKHNRPIEAIQKFKQLLQDSPNDPLSQGARLHLQDACVKAIDIYYQKKQFLSVVKNYLESFDPFIKDVADAKTLLQVGMSYEELGLNDGARKAYQKILQGRQKGQYADLITLKTAKLYLLDGEYEKAEKTLGGFADKYPESQYLVDVLHIIGDILYKKGDIQRAVQMYLSALKKFKGHNRETETYYFLGNAFKKLKSHDKAIWAYKNVILSSRQHVDKEKNTEDIVLESYVKLGDSYYENRRYSEALKAYIQAKRHLNKDERALWVSFQIANCYLTLTKEKEAVQTLQGLKQESDDEFWRTLASQTIENMDWEKRVKGHFY